MDHDHKSLVTVPTAATNDLRANTILVLLRVELSIQLRVVLWKRTGKTEGGPVNRLVHHSWSRGCLSAERAHTQSYVLYQTPSKSGKTSGAFALSVAFALHANTRGQRIPGTSRTKSSVATSLGVVKKGAAARAVGRCATTSATISN